MHRKMGIGCELSSRALAAQINNFLLGFGFSNAQRLSLSERKTKKNVCLRDKCAAFDMFDAHTIFLALNPKKGNFFTNKSISIFVGFFHRCAREYVCIFVINSKEILNAISKHRSNELFYNRN